MTKLSLIFSDIEAGAGNATDDFVEDELLASSIRKHFKESKKYPADLVLNGDIFDFMKCSYKGKYPRHITEKISLAKLKDIYQAHPKLFEIWRDWLEASKTNRIIFVFGNHDYDLVFPKVQKEIKKMIAGSTKAFKNRIVFPGFEFTDNLLHIEHGSQLDKFFYVDPLKFVHAKPSKHADEPFLLLPWGYNALYDHFIHLKEQYPVLDRIVPRIHTIEALPWGLKWRLYFGSTSYMIKGFIYTQFRHWSDLLYRFPVKEFSKYVFTFIRKDFELKILRGARKKLKKSNYNILSVGHNHKGSIRKVGKKKIILNTGNWRDEYTKKRNFFMPKPKSYGYVLHNSQKILKYSLMEVASKMRPISMAELKAMLRGKMDTPS